MVVTCEIEFDNNPYGTYFAGQILTGKITLKSDKPKQVKGIALRINGFAHTSWSESRHHGSQGRRTTRRVHYTGHEDYIASITYLLGSDENNAVIIEPGIHTYNFSCHIPITCPSSFEGLHGHIRYMIKVVLIRPWKFDQTYTKGFTVLKVMDLNYDSPLLRMPAQQDANKVFCCGPFKSDPLKINVTLQRAGFVPGQIIPVAVLVANESNIPVEDIKVELTMRVCYYSKPPFASTKNERIVVSKLKGDSVMKHCNKLFEYQLPVPATPPTCFNLCRIIQIAYQVEVEAKIKGMHANQHVCIPVTIGNVPLMGVIQQQPTSSNMTQEAIQRAMMPESSAQVNELQKSDTNELQTVNLYAASDESGYNNNNNIIPTAPSPWAVDSSIPPPTYEEAVHVPHAKINADEAHDYGEGDFAPRYPVFRISTTPNPPAETQNVVDDKGTWL